MSGPGRGWLSEEEWVTVFEGLYSAHHGDVVSYVRRRTRSVDDADDVVASTFLVAWRRIEDVSAADWPLAWLYSVAFKTLMSDQRKRGRHVGVVEKLGVEPGTVAASVERAVLAADDVERVRVAMLTLSSRDQEILRLVGWEQLNHREIATVLGVSAVNVRSRVHRARRRLQSAFDKLEGTPDGLA